MTDIRDRDGRDRDGRNGDHSVRDERHGPGNYLTPEEGKEFHKLFMTSFIIFTVVAIVAHVLAWMWRPWLPGTEGYSMIDSASNVLALLA